MAWAFGTVATAGAGTGTTLVVTRPASIASGDWQIMSFRLEVTGKTIAFTNGTWTLIRQDDVGTNFTGFLYVSRYAGEGATFTISWDATSAWRSAAIARYTGGASDSTADSADTNGTGFPDNTLDTVVDYTGFAPISDNDLIIYAENNFAGRSNGAVSGTTPTLTTRSDVDGQALGDGVQTTAVAIGNRTSTLAGGAAENLGQIFAFTLGGGVTALPPGLGPDVGMTIDQMSSFI